MAKMMRVVCKNHHVPSGFHRIYLDIVVELLVVRRATCHYTSNSVGPQRVARYEKYAIMNTCHYTSNSVGPQRVARYEKYAIMNTCHYTSN